MRVAHISDLHVEVPPRLADLRGKRVLGAVNLYVRGRRGHFTPETTQALVERVAALEPDLVLCTGDLTATATEAEFALACALLQPLRDRFPFHVIPGNHDVYTGGSRGRFARCFGETAWPAVWTHGGIDFVGTDVCRPDVLSRGRMPEEQLRRLDELLADGSRPAVVLVHYPLRGRRGERYGPASRAMSNAAEVEAVIARHPRVIAVLHGHEHHGYRTEIPRSGPPVVSLNPGSSGYAWLPARRRTAHFNVYRFEDGRLADVERYAYDGGTFQAEAGGAYASGG